MTIFDSSKIIVPFRVKTISKYVVLALLCSVFCAPVRAQIGMQELADSLTEYTGFSPVWSPAVRVKQLRVNGNNVTVRTNTTLRDVRWTPESIKDIKRKVSNWVLGHERGKVTILSANTNIETLVTECARSQIVVGKCPTGKCTDLTDRTIALYPSHGLYFNRDRNEWIWQRATLWTTVEDVYSQEYVRLIRRMLENAGATVLSPRPGPDHPEPGVSGMPQWTEGARYWLVAQNEDSTLWNLYEGDEYKDDMKCRAMWVNAQQAPIDLCLALHTDGLDSGDDTTIVGTLAIYTAKDDDGKTRLRDGRDRERVNRNLADWIQTQVTEDLRHIAPEWTRRQLKEANYCESRVPVVPSIILELLSHKNMADMRYGLDPKFRFAASRAVYKGILRYLNGGSAIVQPLPVQELGIGTDGVLRWLAPTDSLEPSAEPGYYMVYIRRNDGEWDVQQVENATQLKLMLDPGVAYSFYVVAGNDGGLSFPSPMISAYIHDQVQTTNDKRQTTLIVDAFNDVYGVEWFADSTFAGIVPGSYACEDHFSCAYIGEQWDYRRSSHWTDDDNCGGGSCYRDHAGQLTIGNTHDYAVQHGRVLQRMGISYVSCTAGMMEETVTGYRLPVTESPVTHNPSPITRNPSPITLIDIVCGRNRVTFNDIKLYQTISNYLDNGGRLLLSTDHLSALDAKWTKRYLHASYYAAHATRSGRLAVNGKSAYRLLLRPNEEQLFTCHPEGLKPENGATKLLTYEDMRVPAAIGWENGKMVNDQMVNTKTLVFGFPLEAVRDFDNIYQRSIEWLLK